MSADQWLKLIGEEVGKLLHEGETQGAFAERVGLTREQVNIIINHKRDYGITDICQILSATRQPPEWWNNLPLPDQELISDLLTILERGDQNERLIIQTLLRKWAREAELREEGGDVGLYVPGKHQ